MDPNSGKIHQVTDEADARAKGLVPLEDAEAALLKAMPEAQRPAALLAARALHPLGRLHGLTGDDVRQLRNAGKRERRARRGK